MERLMLRSSSFQDAQGLSGKERYSFFTMPISATRPIDKAPGKHGLVTSPTATNFPDIAAPFEVAISKSNRLGVGSTDPLISANINPSDQVAIVQRSIITSTSGESRNREQTGMTVNRGQNRVAAWALGVDDSDVRLFLSLDLFFK
ncbi:unnamed protein product [Protopolystoma xenopodis]|uniref:Uncharacterized protein n=1 Tax=Protopolystoma xenopodis TaxID=117903 RepID=A0A448WNF3_9PLAT|nr:unnamed protein product [Protopolystoma xenopodis]